MTGQEAPQPEPAPWRAKARTAWPKGKTPEEAAVVSPEPILDARRSAGLFGHEQSPLVAICRQRNSHAYKTRADCLSASLLSCPKTVSDSFLHDLWPDCLPTPQTGLG